MKSTIIVLLTYAAVGNCSTLYGLDYNYGYPSVTKGRVKRMPPHYPAWEPSFLHYQRTDHVDGTNITIIRNSLKYACMGGGYIYNSTTRVFACPPEGTPTVLAANTYNGTQLFDALENEYKQQSRSCSWLRNLCSKLCSAKKED